MRAILQITDAEIVGSSYADNDGFPQKQIKTELQVITGSERNGESFLNWFSFRDNGQPPHKSKKAGHLTAAVFGPGEAMGESLDEMAENMKGRYFAAQIGLSDDGKHSRIVHGTLSPASGPDAAVTDGVSSSGPKPISDEGSENESPEGEPEDKEEDLDSIPF